MRPQGRTPTKGGRGEVSSRRLPSLSSDSAASRFRKRGLFVVFVLGSVLGTGLGWAARSRSDSRATQAIAQPPASAQSFPHSYYDLLALTPEELGKVDIAVVNLLCAQGLPGAEKLDIPPILAKIDEWADKVKAETQRHLYRATDPKYAEHYAHSEARLRAEFIVQCLQEDCGVHYNEARINEPEFRNPADSFIYGMVGNGNGGLDYPPDERYRTWPAPISEVEMKSGEFLKSLAPQEELALFLMQRAACLQAHQLVPEERACLAEALRLMPDSITLRLAFNSISGAGIHMARRVPRDCGPSLPPGMQETLPPDPTPRISMAMPGVNPVPTTPNSPSGGLG